jgi:hypothetical protein
LMSTSNAVIEIQQEHNYAKQNIRREKEKRKDNMYA